jgi:rfaE bifunctional protein kinase chain/domain
LNELEKSLDRIAGCRILVFGDIMLDIYRIGDATRISPEAPVPVLLNPKTEYRLGGAAAVAAMCAALGARVTLCGIIGNDVSGKVVSDLLASAGIEQSVDWTYSRRTTTKERTCGIASGRHRQQLVRTDTEDTGPLNADLETALVERVKWAVKESPDIILISDYAKGACSINVVAELNSVKTRVIVDPPRDSALWRERYTNVSCIVPNRQEANLSSAAGIAARLSTHAAIVKLDEEGCEVAVSDDASTTAVSDRIESHARAVHDVTGAGDQFLAVLGCARAVDADWFEAAELANLAAGMQVERQGCDPVTLEQLKTEVTQCQSFEKNSALLTAVSIPFTRDTSTYYEPQP